MFFIDVIDWGLQKGIESLGYKYYWYTSIDTLRYSFNLIQLSLTVHKI